MLLGGNDRLNKRRNFIGKLNDIKIVSIDCVRSFFIAIKINLFDCFFTQHFCSSKVPS